MDRPRLLDLLDGVPHRRLTLITAPLGSGKTALAAQWCAARCPVPVIWLTATSTDTDPGRFDELAREVLDASAAGPGDRVVVIDGIDGPEAGPVVAEVVRSAPAEAHLLVLSRQQLTASTASLRLAGGFGHLEEADLRLQVEELRSLIRAITGSEVAVPLAEALCDDLDGRVAGAVLLASDWDPACTPANHHALLATGYEAIAEVVGSAVLDPLPAETRDLLVRTACLPELSGPLCDLVTGSQRAREALRSLRASGAFLSVGQRTGAGHPLLRFHPVARAALADRRTSEDFEREPELLRAAADWYAGQQLPLLAAECLAQLEDWPAFRELLIANLPMLMANRSFDELTRTLSRLPPDKLLGDVLVAGSLASLYMATGRHRQALDLLGLLRNGAPPRLQLACDVNAAGAYPYLEDPLPVLDTVERAMGLADALGDDELFAHNALNTASVLHYRIIGRSAGLAAAAMAGAWTRGAAFDVGVDPVAATEMLSFVMVQVQGRHATYHAYGGWLDVAAREADAALATAVPGDLLADQNLMHAHLALAEVHRLGGRPDDVDRHLDACLERAELTNRHNYIAAVAASRAALQLDLDRPGRALAVVEAHRAATGHRPPPALAGLLAATEGRALDALGQRQQAREVLAAAPLTSAVAAASVLTTVYRGSPNRARRALAQWPDEPTPLSDVRRAIATAVLHEVAGRRKDADHQLRSALVTAARYGLVQPIAEAGVYLLALLRGIAGSARDGPTVDVARRALAHLDRDTHAASRLTARERLVLQHLATGATLATVADQLVVSVNTIKAHTKAIYRKLGVSTRAEAVALWRPSEPPGLDDIAP